jgi:hypothetical protein
MVALYLCFRFHICDRPILEEYVYQVECGPTPTLVMLTCSTRWPSSTIREMHLFFIESGNYRHPMSTNIYDGHPPQHIP